MNLLRRPQPASPRESIASPKRTRRNWALAAFARYRFARGLALPVGFLCATIACVADPAPAAALALQQETPEGAVTAHVIIVSLDGLRPDAITAESAPTLDHLMHEGSFAKVAQTIMPSLTLPSHTSMLTGQPPNVHGITWNSDEVASRGTVRTPTVFEVAHEHGFRTAAFFSKSKFEHLQVRGSLDYTQAPTKMVSGWLMARTLTDLGRYLGPNRPNLLFVHLAETDYAGHEFGWMSPIYMRALRAVDDALSDIVATAEATFGPGKFTLIVTADHGGHERVHGTAEPSDLTIPWVVWGEGVRAGTVVADTVHTMDTAATALWLLGVPVPHDWAGVPVSMAFSEEANKKAVATHPAPH
jgi:predicted AlkP superfamily pyrophosphatase or phosphodiesterase